MRLAHHFPGLVLDRIPPLIKPFLICIRNLQDDYEKEDALLGMAKIVSQKPGMVVKEFTQFLSTITDFYEPKERLRREVGTLIHNFMREMGEHQWNQQMSGLDRSVRERLAKYYGA